MLPLMTEQARHPAASRCLHLDSQSESLKDRRPQFTGLRPRRLLGAVKEKQIGRFRGALGWFLLTLKFACQETLDGKDARRRVPRLEFGRVTIFMFMHEPSHRLDARLSAIWWRPVRPGTAARLPQRARAIQHAEHLQRLAIGTRTCSMDLEPDLGQQVMSSVRSRNVEIACEAVLGEDHRPASFRIGQSRHITRAEFVATEPALPRGRVHSLGRSTSLKTRAAMREARRF